MGELKLTKTQQKLKQRLEIAKEIYERLSREYLKMTRPQQWNYNLEDHVSATIQDTLVVSDRKAREYIKLIKLLRKDMAVPKII